MHVHIDVNDRPAQKYLDGMLVRGLNQRPTLSWAVDEVADADRRNFFTQGGIFSKWAPLQPETLMNRPPTPPLFGWTGIILYEVTHLKRPPTTIGPSDAEIIVDSDLVRWHHWGTWNNGKRHNPARPLVGVGPFFEIRLAERAANYLAFGRTRELGRLFR